MTIVFFFNNPGPTETCPRPLPDALPIFGLPDARRTGEDERAARALGVLQARSRTPDRAGQRLDRVVLTDVALAKDRKSTRLNSSHANISYAVFCLKKKNTCQPPSAPPRR